MSGERQVKVLYDERTIAERTEALAREIAAAKPKDLLVVAILKGSFMFAADLLRALHRVKLEPQVEFFHLSSYLSGTVSSGTVKILRDIELLGPRSRRSAGRRYSRVRPDAGLRQGPSGGARRAAGSRLHDVGEARKAGS